MNHVPCALFHYFFSQVITEIFCSFDQVSYFHIFMGKTKAKFDKVWNSNTVHFSKSKEFNNTKEFQTNYKDIWFYWSNLLFPVRNLEEFLKHMASAILYNWRYECSSRNFFVQICKIKGAANFYPRCDKLLANSPVRYFRLLRPCMHKVVIILIFMLLDNSSNTYT